VHCWLSCVSVRYKRHHAGLFSSPTSTLYLLTMLLTNRTILITGGSSGIGLETQSSSLAAPTSTSKQPSSESPDWSLFEATFQS
jgi:hypothetical protein